MTIFGSHDGPHILNVEYLEAYVGIWKYMKVYGCIQRYMGYMTRYGGIWRYMKVYAGAVRCADGGGGRVNAF